MSLEEAYETFKSWVIPTIFYVVLNIFIMPRFLTPKLLAEIEESRPHTTRKSLLVKDFIKKKEKRKKTEGPSWRPENGLQVLTLTPTVLVHYGRFDETAQLMQILCKQSRVYFRNHS